MSGHAESMFVIDGWEEEVISAGPPVKITRTRVSKKFSGDIEGSAIGDMTMAVTEAGSAAYVGFDRIEATIRGRSGAFVLHHNAMGNARGEGIGSWTVLDDSGTGELAGLRGTGTLTRHEDGSHSFTLDYEIGRP